MRLGSSTIWWKHDALTEQHLAQLAAAGVQDVELSDHHPNFNYLRAAWLKNTGEAARREGLTVGTVHTHLVGHDPELRLTHPDASRCQRALEAYLRLVDALHLLGAKTLLTHDLDLPLEDGEEQPDMRANALTSLKTIGDYAEQAGIVVALENLPGRWSGRVSRLVQFVRDLNHNAVRLCYDVAHAYGSDDVKSSLAETLAQLQVLHINDNDGQRSHTLPGAGRIDWQEVMTQLKQHGSTAYFMYELADSNDLPRLQENFRWLKTLAA